MEKKNYEDPVIKKVRFNLRDRVVAGACVFEENPFGGTPQPMMFVS